MADKAAVRNMLGSKKQKTVNTKELTIRGHLLQWEGVIIQISNISLISSAELETPRFPLWSILVLFAGLFLNQYAEGVLVIALIITGVAIWLWYAEAERVRNQKYLNVLLNSGFTYSILFTDEAFLNQVMQVFSNIFEDGNKTGTNYYDINISNSTISKGSVGVEINN